MTYILFASRKTKWRFDAVEMSRFNVQKKLKAKNIQPGNKEPASLIKKMQNLQRKIHKE